MIMCAFIRNESKDVRVLLEFLYSMLSATSEGSLGSR